MDVSKFNHSLSEGHLGWFHFLTNAAMNTPIQNFEWMHVFNSLGKIFRSGTTGVKKWIFKKNEYLCPPKFIFWNLIPNVMGFGSGTFRRWLGRGRNPHSGISAFMKKTLQNSLAPLAMWGHSTKIAVYESGSGPLPDTESAGTLVLDFLSLQTVRNK